MLIETDSQLLLNSCHEMEVSLDDTVLTLTGRIANQQEITSRNGTKYDTGIEFIDMSEKDQGIMKEYLDAIERQK